MSLHARGERFESRASLGTEKLSAQKVVLAHRHHLKLHRSSQPSSRFQISLDLRPQLQDWTKMSTQRLAASASRQINAVVVSAGLMEKTVKVRIGQQKWNAHIRKVYSLSLLLSLPTHKFSNILSYHPQLSPGRNFQQSQRPRLTSYQHFNRTSHLLVHDPASSLRIGDIISISPGWRASKHVHHVVNSILAPFGDPIEARPKVPSEDERLATREAKRAAKEERRRLARIGDVVEEGDVEGETQA